MRGSALQIVRAILRLILTGKNMQRFSRAFPWCFLRFVTVGEAFSLNEVNVHAMFDPALLVVAGEGRGCL